MKNTQSELLHSNIKNPALSLSVQDCFFERFHGSIFEENNKGGGILDAIFDVHFHFRGKNVINIVKKRRIYYNKKIFETKQRRKEFGKMSQEQETTKQEEKKKKKKKEKADGKIIALRVFLIILIVLVILAIVFVIIFHSFYSKLNYDDGKGTYITTEFEDDSIDPNATDSDASVIASVEDEIKKNMEDGGSELMFSGDVYNILLIGNDSRDKNTLGRSDSMILVSINKRTEQIIMTSIMRDSYVYIPGYGNSRINVAYAYGGPDLLMDTIETNFKIKIDKYVGVNFFSFVDVIDAIDGVQITVDGNEAALINQENAGNQLPGAGTYTLTGAQALTYSRIRHYGNSDYQRTERQRTVLQEIFNEMGSASLGELKDVLNAVLPEVTTDIKESEMLSLMVDFVRKYKDFEIVQCRVPDDGTITDLVINGAMVLGIDLPANIDYMQEHIYGK